MANWWQPPSALALALVLVLVLALVLNHLRLILRHKLVRYW
jgi:hypothetical protein